MLLGHIAPVAHTVVRGKVVAHHWHSVFDHFLPADTAHVKLCIVREISDDGVHAFAGHCHRLQRGGADPTDPGHLESALLYQQLTCAGEQLVGIDSGENFMVDPAEGLIEPAETLYLALVRLQPRHRSLNFSENPPRHHIQQQCGNPDEDAAFVNADLHEACRILHQQAKNRIGEQNPQQTEHRVCTHDLPDAGPNSSIRRARRCTLCRPRHT